MTQLTVFAEDTQVTTDNMPVKAATTDAGADATVGQVANPTTDSTTDSTTDVNTSDSTSPDNLTGDIDESQLTETTEDATDIVQPDEAEILPEFVFYGERQVPEGFQRLIDIALDTTNMPIDVLVNGKYLKSTKDALMINNTTYVPIRAIFEVLGYKDIAFDNETYKVTTKSTLGEFQFLLNTTEVYVNGVSTHMEQPSLMINGTTMIPLRFISEFFKFQITWDSKYYTVSLTNTAFPVNQAALNGRFYTFDELTTFSKLIMKEAGGTSYATKHAVASVVMNQVRHPGLPNTVNGVIYYVSRSAHFPPAHKAGFLDTVPNKECIMAAKMTLRGENSAGTCIYFNTRPFKGKTVFKVSDGVYFCY